MTSEVHVRQVGAGLDQRSLALRRLVVRGRSVLRPLAVRIVRGKTDRDMTTQYTLFGGRNSSMRPLLSGA